MTGKFIYAFSEDDAQELIASGYTLLSSSEMSGKKTYVFAADDTVVSFTLDTGRFVRSDTMTL